MNIHALAQSTLIFLGVCMSTNIIQEIATKIYILYSFENTFFLYTENVPKPAIITLINKYKCLVIFVSSSPIYTFLKWITLEKELAFLSTASKTNASKGLVNFLPVFRATIFFWGGRRNQKKRGVQFFLNIRIVKAKHMPDYKDWVTGKIRQWNINP